MLTEESFYFLETTLCVYSLGAHWSCVVSRNSIKPYKTVLYCIIEIILHGISISSYCIITKWQFSQVIITSGNLLLYQSATLMQLYQVIQHLYCIVLILYCIILSCKVLYCLLLQYYVLYCISHPYLIFNQ